MRTTDMDKTRAVIAQHFYSNFIDQLRPEKRLATDIRITRIGAITVGDCSFGTDLKLSFDELGAYHVDLPLSGN